MSRRRGVFGGDEPGAAGHRRRAVDDDEELLLGPVLVGGAGEMGLRTVDGEPLPDFDVEVDDGRIFSVERGTGVFGPTTQSG